MKRHRHTMRELVALFNLRGGKCHICGGLIHTGEKWEVSHPIALELGGRDEESNWFLAHKKCHAIVTATQDQPAIAKAKRREAAHKGAKPRPVAPIKSAPFAKSTRTIERAKREKMPLPPRRPLYV
jgi:5-methylcytosine-specific restriction enzyme A